MVPTDFCDFGMTCIMVRGEVEARLLAETDRELGKGRRTALVAQFRPDNSTHPRYHCHPHQRHPKNDRMSRTFGSFFLIEGVSAIYHSNLGHEKKFLSS